MKCVSAHSPILHFDVTLILHFDLKIKELKKEGKDYLWPRPAACPCCGGKLWGHGYTARYFSGYSKSIWLKRYRCIECHAVHTLRPKTHWRRFQAGISTIIESLRCKIIDNQWIQNNFSRQGKQYWWQGFKTQLRINNPAAVGRTLNHLKSLLTKNIIAATHSFRWFQMMEQGSLRCVQGV